MASGSRSRPASRAVVVDSWCVRYARLAHLDEGLELLAALGDFLFGQGGLVEAELAHQRALLGAADLHAQRRPWACRPRRCLPRRRPRPRVGFGLDIGFGVEFALEVGEVVVGAFQAGLLLRLEAFLLLSAALAVSALAALGFGRGATTGSPDGTAAAGAATRATGAAATVGVGVASGLTALTAPRARCAGGSRGGGAVRRGSLVGAVLRGHAIPRLGCSDTVGFEPATQGPKPRTFRHAARTLRSGGQAGVNCLECSAGGEVAVMSCPCRGWPGPAGAAVTLRIEPAFNYTAPPLSLDFSFALGRELCPARPSGL